MSVNIITVLCSTPDRRRRFMAFLISMVAHRQVRLATCVTALLGRSNVRQALTLAKSRFRTISFEECAQQDYTSSWIKHEATYGKTKKTRLGSCDAFISHSWHDDGPKKFDKASVINRIRSSATTFKKKRDMTPEEKKSQEQMMKLCNEILDKGQDPALASQIFKDYKEGKQLHINNYITQRSETVEQTDADGNKRVFQEKRIGVKQQIEVLLEIIRNGDH